MDGGKGMEEGVEMVLYSLRVFSLVPVQSLQPPFALLAFQSFQNSPIKPANLYAIHHIELTDLAFGLYRPNPRAKLGRAFTASCVRRGMDGLMSLRRMRAVMIISIRRFVGFLLFFD